MASTAKEFLRKRVVEHVWPKLVVSLDQLRDVACDATPTGTHGMEYKLLVKILQTVGKLCREVRMNAVSCCTVLIFTQFCACTVH